MHLPAGLPAPRAGRPPAPQRHRDDHPLGGERDVANKRAAQAQQPVECGGDPARRPPTVAELPTPSSLPDRRSCGSLNALRRLRRAHRGEQRLHTHAFQASGDPLKRPETRISGLPAARPVAPDGTPRALQLTSPKVGERDVCLGLLARCHRSGRVIVIGDKGYAGRDFEADAADLGATIVRPRRHDEPGHAPHLAPIRQRIESIFQTCKDLLTLERHGARTLHGLRVRICARFLALAAAIALNHRLGRPPRALAAYCA
jgi:hypothetical protein